MRADSKEERRIDMVPNKFLAAFAALLLAAVQAHADAIPGRWDKVDALQGGTPIVVTLKSGDRLEAAFRHIRPAEIVLQDEQGVERAVPKEAVLKVESGKEVRDRLRNGAIIGAVVGSGAAVLALAGYAARETASGPIWGGEATGYYLGAALVGAGVGALSGMAIDAAGRSREVLYRAR